MKLIFFNCYIMYNAVKIESSISFAGIPQKFSLLTGKTGLPKFLDFPKIIFRRFTLVKICGRLSLSASKLVNLVRRSCDS